MFLNWLSPVEYACRNTRNSREITSLPKSKNMINMARHFNHRSKLTAYSSQDSFQSIKFVDRPILGKLGIFHIFSKSFESFTKHTWRSGKILHVVDHVAILIPSFRGLRLERLGLWLSFCGLNTKKKKNDLQMLSLAATQARLKQFVCRWRNIFWWR